MSDNIFVRTNQQQHPFARIRESSHLFLSLPFRRPAKLNYQSIVIHHVPAPKLQQSQRSHQARRH